MRRREFIALAGGAIVWPIALRTQQPGKVYRLAIFSAGSKPAPPLPNRSPFFDALRDLGWIEGKNIVVEERFADDQFDRLPEQAAELVRLNVDVIVPGIFGDRQYVASGGLLSYGASQLDLFRRSAGYVGKILK